jgi:hypothetical protein
MSQQVICLDLVNVRWYLLSMPVELSYGFSYQPSTPIIPPRILVGDSNQSIWQRSNDATSDGTVEFLRRWQSPTLVGEVGGDRNFVIQNVSLEFQSVQESHLTIRVSDNRGASFITEHRVTLPASSVLSRFQHDCRVAASYPVVEFQSSNTTHTLWRAEIAIDMRGRS